MNIQTRLSVLETQYAKTFEKQKDPAIIRAIRMLITSGRPRTSKAYRPNEEDKITKEEWEEDCQKAVLWEKVHYGDKASQEKIKWHNDLAKIVTKLGGWR